jgi:RHS repeat-associated protein
VTFDLTDLHGDVVETASSSPAATEPLAKFRFDEFGEPVSGNSAGRFGWLGGKLRRTELSSGVIQMGARSYIPSLGRFLTPDPVRGGSANAYDYADQDPVNAFDLNGNKLCIGVGGPNEACGNKARQLRQAAHRANETGKIQVAFQDREGARRFAAFLKTASAARWIKNLHLEAEEATAEQIYALEKKAAHIAQEEVLFDGAPKEPGMEWCRMANGVSWFSYGTIPESGGFGYVIGTIITTGTHMAC